MDIEEYYDIENHQSIKKLPYGVKLYDSTINETRMSQETWYGLCRGLLKEEDLECYIVTYDEEV